MNQWNKLGLVFDPAKHRGPSWMQEFAQAPATLLFDDFVRVYFSCRPKADADGKYVSNSAWVDLDRRDLTKVLRVAEQPVLQLGGRGQLDEFGIYPVSPIRVGSSRRESVSVETSIGLAKSQDGGEWFERAGLGPVLSSSTREPFLVGDGFVLQVGSLFHMWYIFGTRWNAEPGSDVAERTYKIGHAVSTNGVDWERRQEGRQLIPDRLGEFESQALPSVFESDGQFHMVFCYRHSVDFRTNSSRSYRLGHATSCDLVNWSRSDEALNLSPNKGGWDTGMMCYPSVCRSGGRRYLLYNGNEFGRFGFGAAILEEP